MVYDPCAPQIPAAPAVGAPHAPHHHPAYRLLGRRVSRTHRPKIIADACLKTGQKIPKPVGLAAIVGPLFDPGVLTVAGMSVVGASAFGGAILPNILGRSVIIPTGTNKTPPHHPVLPTVVPEPGSAAILAAAMVVVLISAWFQGGRALRTPPESTIASKPLPKRRRAAPRQRRDTPAPAGGWTLATPQR